MKNQNLILEKTLNFSVKVIAFCELLEKERKYIIANQLLKSSTSIGANVHEAQNAESKIDFIHKFKLAAKELEETKYWLLLCEKADSYPFDEDLKAEVQEISLIIYKILSTSKKSII